MSQAPVPCLAESRPLRALAALVLYVAAALLLPALHLTFHDRAHDHLPHGLRLHPLGAAHLQAGSADEHSPEHRHSLRHDAPQPQYGPVLSAPPTWPSHPVVHGAGSLAHFAAGYVAAAEPAVRPLYRALAALPPPRLFSSWIPVPQPLAAHSPRAPPPLVA